MSDESKSTTKSPLSLILESMPACRIDEQDCENCEYGKPAGSGCFCDYPYIGNKMVWRCG